MVINKIIIIFLTIAIVQSSVLQGQNTSDPLIVILGIGQDAGYPQADCHKECCQKVWDNPELKKHVSCIAVVDPRASRSWLFDATPDITKQLKKLEGYSHNQLPDGIFLTHAHIGHYTGLIYMGREAMSTTKLPVFAMPRMSDFLSQNGPWSQLVSLNNIELREMTAGEELRLSASVTVTPLIVPHRDEYSETVGFLIKGPNHKALFIPDINKWELWEQNIVDVIKEVDYALIDGSFFDGNELPNRDMSEIPHPFVVESMALFDSLSSEDKAKVHFIHFNHTNPLLHLDSNESHRVVQLGFNIASEGLVIRL